MKWICVCNQFIYLYFLQGGGNDACKVSTFHIYICHCMSLLSVHFRESIPCQGDGPKVKQSRRRYARLTAKPGSQCMMANSQSIVQQM